MQKEKESPNKFKLKLLSYLDNMSLILGTPTGSHKGEFWVELDSDMDYFILYAYFSKGYMYPNPQVAYFETLEDIQKIFPKINIIQFKENLLKKRQLLIAKFIAELW